MNVFCLLCGIFSSHVVVHLTAFHIVIEKLGQQSSDSLAGYCYLRNMNVDNWEISCFLNYI